MKILLVEDDILLAENLSEALTNQRYVVDMVTNGEIACQQSQMLDYDLMVLDVTLPKLDGFGVCRKLRAQGNQMPILMLTGRDTTNDKVKGLDAGADDYLVKPVDLPELFARIRALLRRGQSIAPPVLKWGDLRLDPSTYEVSYDHQLIHFTRKEYSLLEFFLRNGRRVLTRSVIIEHVWSFENPPEEETVNAYIKSLRRKLRLAGAPRDLIETVHSVGYRLKQLTPEPVKQLTPEPVKQLTPEPVKQLTPEPVKQLTPEPEE
ncbi:response regulator transcription factor [Moorena bouillonii]|uniref:response regulator transcription factor n=1 Tax=Moorena bouillonii TaxID=207920 RepID=UPI002692E0C4|nr:response regulator transcription factor [Moorena bouillonii]